MDGGGDGRYVIDAGWLGHTGVGRLLSTLLDGLSELRPAGEWTLWSRPDSDPPSWPGSRVVATRHAPMALAAQRDLAAAPPGLLVSVHAVRPLTLWRRGALYVCDTIPLRWTPPAQRLAWRSFFRLSVVNEASVIVISDDTARHVHADLGVPLDRLSVVEPVPDMAFVKKIRSARAERKSEPLLLYVGQMKPHKNVKGAVAAFAASRFRADGGRMAIVGGYAAAHHALDRFVQQEGISGVVQRPSVSDGELIDWYARAAGLILPSFEEGYGLPVVEALAAGIPVCCSDLDCLRRASQGLAELFDPMSVPSMTSAIDRVMLGPRPGQPGLKTLRTPRTFAEEFIAALPPGGRLR